MATTLIRLDTKKLNNKIFDYSEDIMALYKRSASVVKSMSVQGAQQVFDITKELDARYLDIEADIEFLITKAPVDKDLRRTLAYLSISKELKRIADYTKSIAKYTVFMQKIARPKSIEHIVNMHKYLMDILIDLPKLLKTEDFELAIEMSKRDKKLDTKLVEIRNKIVESISKKEDLDAIDEKIFCLSAVSRLERAGDHIVKICEMIVYIHNGQHVFLE